MGRILDRWTPGGKIMGLVLLAVFLLVAIRAACELAMMREYGPDAQMAIWQMFLVVKIVFWLATGVVAAGIVTRLRNHPRAKYIGAVLLLAWVAAVGNASWQYLRGRQALADARDPDTSSERLASLVHFRGIQSGYELDNRLALNPATPTQALRELAQRRDQSGTLTCLLKNPHTPNDVLQQLQQGHP